MRYIPAFFVVVLIIYGLIDCIRSEPADVRSIPKPVWILIIIILPFIGVLLWFFLGRPQYSEVGSGSAGSSGSTHPGSGAGTFQANRPARLTAPDDDPAFLRNLEVNRAHKLEAERLRKLKAELEAREAKLREQHPKDGPKLRDQHPNDEPKH